jgi:hypothetical protein
MTLRRKRGLLGELAKKMSFDRKLAAYLAASTSMSAVLSSDAKAIVVSNTKAQPFGINGEVNIDFNCDGQTDYQIDHDRYTIPNGGPTLDYLQIDKNDASSAANPYPIDNLHVFPTNGTNPNSDHEFLTAAGDGESGYYPSALLSGAQIGPLASHWELYQEGTNFVGSHKTIRPNRLIDEDASQIDAANPNPPADSTGQIAPFGTPGWVGLSGATRYLGVRIDFNDAGHANLNQNGSQYWYGWIGVRITNEDDATGEVTGWGYETELGKSILAGQTGVLPGDYNGDNKVDASDYVIWRKNNGLTTGALFSQGDGTGDGKITQADCDCWRANYGNTTGTGSGAGYGAGANAVPEPGSLLLSAASGLAVVGAYICRRIRGR